MTGGATPGSTCARCRIQPNNAVICDFALRAATRRCMTPHVGRRAAREVRIQRPKEQKALPVWCNAFCVYCFVKRITAVS